MKHLLAAAGFSILMLGQAIAEETIDDPTFGTCTVDGSRKYCTKETVINADNCEPQIECRAEYTKMEKVTVLNTLIINGRVMNHVRSYRRPIGSE